RRTTFRGATASDLCRSECKLLIPLSLSGYFDTGSVFRLQISSPQHVIMQPINNTSLKERLAAAEPARPKLMVATRTASHLLNRELSLIEFFRHGLDESHD